MEGHFFLSYSASDGREFARRLADRLIATPPPIPVWLDERELQPGTDWDEQIVEALRTCAGLLFLMTVDSVHPKSECKREWTRALRYKKPIIPLLFDANAEMPYRLEPRQYLDFARDHEPALARLRDHIRWRSSPQGLLQGLKERLADAERDLPRADDAERARIEEEISTLREEIAGAGSRPSRTRRAQPGKPGRASKALSSASASLPSRWPRAASTKFINPPPTTAPSWFQDRHVETELVGDFLQGPGLADDDGDRARRHRQDGDGLPPAQGPGGRPPARRPRDP